LQFGKGYHLFGLFIQQELKSLGLFHDRTKLLKLVVTDGLEHSVLYPRGQIANEINDL
jgi:hypothetical protein